MLLSSWGATAATQFAGLWRPGNDANYVNVGLSPATLNNLLASRHTNGLRMVNVRTYVENGTRRWAGIWRSGSDAEYLNYDRTFAQLADLYGQRYANGLRLVDIDTYLSGSTRYWAGLWRSGSDSEYFYAGLNENQLVATNNFLVTRNLRLIDVETYVDGGSRFWAALWRSGTDDSFLATGLTPAGLAFADLYHRRQGLNLIDVERYPDEFGAPLWAAVWRATGVTSSDLTMDFEKLSAEVTTQFAGGWRMFSLSAYDVECAASCHNNLVATNAYNYGITRTATHCNGLPGTCSAPPPNSFVTYRWPVVVNPAGNYVRLSAVNVPDQFLTLPFRDPLVEHRGIWLYSPGSWHHAADYSRDDVATFRVRAAAPGQVIHIGWDVWSGNTIVVSHNVNGQTDNYRTIYMHLRNGADNDCANAWNLTIPWFATVPSLNEDKTNYIALLNATGCTQNPATRNPDPNHWGSNSDTIRVSIGQKVARGQFLAWAGQTGPGGNRNKDRVNTHLHIFFAHRDPTDNNWYFFDPYGIYSTPECYPAGVTDPLSTDCVRYPVAWQGNTPEYPPPVLDWEKVYRLRLGPYLKFSWEDPAAALQSSAQPDRGWNDVDTAENPYYAPYSGLPQFFRLHTR
jgi:murein DD-endopeptidase MepM/ murein hydrolase activator NlpD